MPHHRTIMLAVVAASGLVFAASTVPLASRIAEFNRTSHLVRYHAEVQDAREFQLGSYPRVRLMDATDEAGRTVLSLEFGQSKQLIPIKPPAARNLPTLAAYDEWAKVLAINEVSLDERGRSAPKPGTERLFVVVRRTPDGADPDSWGAVRRSEWVFDFYELTPEGRIVASIRRWPRSASAEAALRTDSPALASIAPLQERSVEYFAAMHVIPKLNVPKHKFDDTALSWRTLGWTLPASMLSGLVLVPSVFFALAPGRTARSAAHRP